MKVGLARVSTQHRTQDTSIAAQEKALLNAGCDQVITVRESAFKGPRRGWHELRKLVASGKVKEVLCIDQSRLARDGTDLEFLEECAAQGVTVRTLSGGLIETATVGGFVQAGVFSVINQAFSRQLSLKTKDGLDRRKAEGFYACGRVPYGYAHIDGKVVPHPEQWPTARQMFLDLLAIEMNINRYVREQRPGWTTSGIKSWVTNSMLRGIIPRQQEGVKPLITPEEWARAQRLLQHRSGSRSRSTSTVHLFTGLVRCQACGKNLKYKTVRRGAKRLHCANPACSCYGRGIAVPLLRSQVVLELQAAARRMQKEVEQSTRIAEREKPKEQVQAESKLATLEQLQASTDLPGLDTAISALRGEIAEFSAPAMGPDWGGLAELIATPGVLDRFTDEQLRPLVLDYIAEIVYLGNPREVQVIVQKGP